MNPQAQKAQAITEQMVSDAKSAYKAASESLKATIRANQIARAKWQGTTDQAERARLKEAYDGTRAAHQAALAVIRAKRSEYHALLLKFNEQEDGATNAA